MSEIINHNLLEKADQKFDAWKLISNDKTEIVRVVLKPGEIIDTHINPLLVYFYILSGGGELSVESEKYVLAKNDLISVEKGINRKWVNTSEINLEFLVIKEQ
jgi:quercetin dioxygenase-like cupin family protein